MFLFNSKLCQFHVEKGGYIILLDLKSCYLGTKTSGIYFEYNCFPINPFFLISSDCGLSSSNIAENGITFLYEGDVKFINQKIYFDGNGKYWGGDEYFYGLFRDGDKVFGLEKSYRHIFIGNFNSNGLLPGLMLSHSGIHVIGNSLPKFYKNAIMWGLFDATQKLIHGKFYSFESNVVRSMSVRKGCLHGLYTMVRPTRIFRCWYINGEREGGFIDYGRSTITGTFHKGNIRGVMKIRNNKWNKTLLYTRKGCVKGSIKFSQNKKFILRFENGVEKIDAVVVNNKYFKNAMEDIQNVPFKYRCPISLMCMTNPVTSCLKRQHYDHICLKKWFEKHRTEPVTNENLKSRNIIFNYELREEIYNFICSYFEHSTRDQRDLPL